MADSIPAELLFQVFGQFVQLFAALLFDVIAQLVGQCRRFGALAAGIGEDMDVTEADLPDEIETVLPKSKYKFSL